MSAALLSLLTAALSEIPHSNSGNFYQLLAQLCGAGGGVSPIPAPAVSFVWRPGGVPSANVFTTAEDLFTATEAIDGLVEVAVDSSLGVPQITALRPYNARNIRWTKFGDTNILPVVDVLAGAQVDGLLTKNSELVTFDLYPAGAPVLTYNADDLIVMDRGASLRNRGVSPAIVNNNTLVFVLQSFAEFINSGAPVLDNGALGQSIFVVADFATLGSDSIAGTPGSFLQEQYTVGSVRPSSMTTFTGTRSNSRFPPGSLNEKWCSQSGDDESGDGTLERPYRTIARALQDDVGQSLVVKLQNGTYVGVDIPTTPVPRPSLTIQGCASNGANEVNIVPGPSGSAINVQPGVFEAPFVRSLVLRNLNCDGDGVSPAVRVVNALGSPANTFLESADGLWIENCFLNGNGTDALFVDRAGKVNLLNNQYNGNVQMGQCGGGFALNNEHLSGIWFVNFDPTAVGPLSGALPFRFKSCDLLDVSLNGAFNVEIDAATKGTTLVVSPADFGIGATPVFRCSGEFGEAFTTYDPADVTVHNINYDQAHIDDFSAFYLAPGSAIRQVLSFKGGVGRNVGVDELMDLDALDTQAIFYAAAGVGAAQGTIDRRFYQVDTNLDVVPTVVPIDPPFPVNAYAATIQPLALPAVALSTAFTPTSGASFSHISTAGAAAETARALLTRYP